MGGSGIPSQEIIEWLKGLEEELGHDNFLVRIKSDGVLQVNITQ